MNPFYFGTADRRLFGVHTPARAGARAGSIRAIVLCPPWGQEYLRAHRSMRLLADMLAGAGNDVLRFDYYGTGDSGGDMVDGSVQGWEADIETAIDELKDVSGAPKVALVGLRLGAMLAARVAARRRRDVGVLVLWDPVVSGTAYVSELLQTAMEREHSAERPRQRPAEIGGGHELLGFPLTASMTQAIEGLELGSAVASLPVRTHSVVSQGARSTEETRRALGSNVAKDRIVELAGRPPWTETDQIMAGEVPIDLLRYIVSVIRDGTPA